MLNKLYKHINPYRKYITDYKTYLPLYKERITVFRALLIGSLPIGLIMMLIGGKPKMYFLSAWVGLLLFAFITELLMFVLQLSRRECLWVEAILLVAITAGGVFFM
ncbi:MAG: hypothetical protein JST82_01310 [Bacteroidetes bacterium]|nr:hypothetical protein [Bacteroidota bacterium]